MTIQGYNPATGEPVGPAIASTTLTELNELVEAASRAFFDYRDRENSQRAAFLRTVAENLNSKADDFAALTTQETALPEGRIRGELGRTSNQLRLFANIVEDGSWVDAHIDPAMPEREPLPRPDCRRMLRALGPVAVFGASNFPLAFSTAGGDTASALAAGCPVIVKAHSSHPGTCQLAGQAILDAAESTGMPEGVFAQVFGSGQEIGSALVKHPAIKAVGFTGSFAGGKSLFDLAAARDEPIPVYAEMGSVNPVFLLPEALATHGPKLAEGLHQSAMLGAGQFCTNPGLVLYDGNAQFREAMQKLYAGTPPACMLNQKIADSYGAGVEKLLEGKVAEALSVPAESGAHSHVSAALFEIDAQELLENPALAHEVFGPLTMLVKYNSPAEVFEVLQVLGGQLTATIHAEGSDYAAFAELPSRLELLAGRVIFNQFPTGVEVGYAMIHGGPYPATTDSRSTSVGASAINRFARPVCYQNFPQEALPAELRDANPLGLLRWVDGKLVVGNK